MLRAAAFLLLGISLAEVFHFQMTNFRQTYVGRLFQVYILAQQLLTCLSTFLHRNVKHAYIFYISFFFTLLLLNTSFFLAVDV